MFPFQVRAGPDSPRSGERPVTRHREVDGHAWRSRSVAFVGARGASNRSGPEARPVSARQPPAFRRHSGVPRCRQRATSVLRDMRVRRWPYAALRYFPCNWRRRSGVGRTARVHPTASLPAHHSWGLVFGRQSGARSRQVLETGATAWRRRRHGRFCPPRRGSRQGKQLQRYANTTSNRVRFCGGRAYPNMILRSPKRHRTRSSFSGVSRRRFAPSRVEMLPRRPWPSATIATLTCASSSASLGAEWSLARTLICWLTDDALRIPLLKADPKLLHSGHCLPSPYGSRQR